MKRLLSLLLSLVLCFALIACNGSRGDFGDPSTPEGDGSAGPLLYKVTDEEGNIVWLFGSIHVGRDDFYPLPDYVLDAFEGSDALAVEADIVSFENDMSAQMEAMKLFVYSDGSKITDHVSDEIYKTAVEILKENSTYMAMLDYYNASFWSSLIDSCLYLQLEIDTENGIDRHLMELATETGKEIREVESVMFQYRMLSGFSEELQAMLLESSVAQYSNLSAAGAELDAMMDLWVSGNEKAFADYLEASPEFETIQEAALYTEYNNAMITERNESMTEYAIDALASGDEVFICVGAAHVVGEGAMADLLAEAGYTVELVKSGATAPEVSESLTQTTNPIVTTEPIHTTQTTQTTVPSQTTNNNNGAVPYIDYDGKEFEFGATTEAFNGYDYRMAIVSPEGSVDALDVAVYERNQWVEDALNCKIAVGDIHYGNWNHLLANIYSGDCTFESLLMQYDVTCATFITGGYFTDMNRYALDWEADYWNPSANQSLVLNGKQYCAVSDISYMSHYGYAMTVFNTAVEQDLLISGILDKRLYDVVLDDEFTLDKMIEIGRMAVRDLDGGGIDYLTDRVGIMSDYSQARNLMISGGYRFVRTDENGTLSGAVDDVGFGDYFTKIFDLFTDEDLFSPYSEYVTLQEDRTLFCMVTYPPLLREKMSAGSYGILPMPKGTESQEKYLTPGVQWNGQVLGIPVSIFSENYAFVTDVLNAMAYKSYEGVNEVFYNYALGYEKAPDDASIEMFRIIRDGITYDYGVSFDFANCCTDLEQMIGHGYNTFASTYDGKKEAMDAAIEELLENLNR